MVFHQKLMPKPPYSQYCNHVPPMATILNPSGVFLNDNTLVIVRLHSISIILGQKK